MTDLIVTLAQFLADVASNDPAMPVPHDGGCGERIAAPCGAPGPVQRPAELLRNGDTVCHLCRQTFRPGEPVICHRRPA